VTLSVAIADDHPAVLHGLRHVLGTSPVRCDVVAAVQDGHALLQALRGRSCDVALVDWSMPSGPGPHGRALLETLKARYPDLTQVVMTASLQPALLGACLAAGAKGLYDKRSGPETLPLLLARAARGKLSISPGFESILAHYYLDRQYWGTDNRGLLTAREQEVLDMSMAGLTGRDIAERLGRSEKTISRQRRSALDKLGLNAEALPTDAYSPTAVRMVTNSSADVG
jgi:two-component system capsular synthesis response regulator RcsB